MKQRLVVRDNDQSNFESEYNLIREKIEDYCAYVNCSFPFSGDTTEHAVSPVRDNT